MFISNKGQAKFVERILIIFLISIFVFTLYSIINSSVDNFARGYFILKSYHYSNLLDFYVSVLKKNDVISGEICILKDRDTEIRFRNDTIIFKNDKIAATYVHKWKYNLTGLCLKSRKICIRKKGNTIQIYYESLPSRSLSII